MQSSNVTVPLSKTRKLSTTTVQTIQNTKSMLTIKDRQNARSVLGLKLTDYYTLSSRAQTMNIKFKVLQLKPTPLFDIDGTQLKSISWKKFHCILHREESPQTVIGYGPFHPRSPTQPDVVKESVDYCIQVSRLNRQVYCVLSGDQAIYDIVLGLQTKHLNYYDKLILRMGGFHIALNFLGAVGHLCKGSGLGDVLTAANVCNARTANKIMAGND